MIQINQNDFPIEVAVKLIKATKRFKPSPYAEALSMGLTGKKMGGTMDMFSREELREIALYLLLYTDQNKEDE